MAWGVRWYLVGSIILGLLGVLAGCSGGGFFAEREPWRHEAEVQCLNMGAVKEGAGIVRIRPIRGPGMCGADFPLKVSTLGENGPLGYSDELRPPGDIPRGAPPPRWPIRPAEPPYQSRVLPDYQSPPPQPPRRDTAPDEPVSLNPPGVVDRPTVPAEPYDFRRPYGVTPAAPPPKSRSPSPMGSPRDDFSPEPYERRPLVDAPGPPRDAPRGSARESPPGALGPARDIPPTPAFTPVAVSPAAMRWFRSPVVEIKQISAYSCRGMNGNSRASISEHAFGNALDIAAFTLADGRKITVKNGWRGLPEEQGFLRDVQAAACDQFSTVLAPGSNVYHYDHIHVDLMRRRDGHRACNPHSVSGEEVAARAARYAIKRDPGITGSLAPRRSAAPRWPFDPDEERRERALPMAQPGEDGEDD